MKEQKSKGGRGKVEGLRNRAVVILHRADPKSYNTNTMEKLFGRARKTISGIIKRDMEKYKVGELSTG